MVNLLPLVRQIAAEHPGLLRTNTGETCYAFITLVLARMKAEGHVGWGYVGKTEGEGQYRPVAGFPRQVGPYTITGVSHDAIASPTQRVDLLGGGNDGPEPFPAPASPIWLDIPPEHWRPNNPIIPFDGAPLPPVLIVPPPPVVPSYEALGGDAFFRSAVGVPLAADMALAGQTLNDGSSVWFARTIYSLLVAHLKGGPVDPDAIVKKHRNEWRQVLGLPAVP